MGRRKRRFFWIILLAIGVFVAYVSFEHLYVSRIQFAEEEIDSLTKLQEKQLDVFFRINTLLTGLATLVLAGMAGAYAFNRHRNGRLSSFQILAIILSCAFSVLSIGCGYFAHNKVLWMLENKFFNLANPQMLWTSRVQFWTLGVAAAFLAYFAYSTFRKQEAEIKEAEEEAGEHVAKKEELKE